MIKHVGIKQQIKQGTLRASSVIAPDPKTRTGRWIIKRAAQEKGKQ